MTGWTAFLQPGFVVSSVFGVVALAFALHGFRRGEANIGSGRHTRRVRGPKAIVVATTYLLFGLWALGGGIILQVQGAENATYATLIVSGLAPLVVVNIVVWIWVMWLE